MRRRTGRPRSAPAAGGRRASSTSCSATSGTSGGLSGTSASGSRWTGSGARVLAPSRSGRSAMSRPSPSSTRRRWAKVQERNKANAKGPGRPGRAGYFDHVLSGLLRCGACGSPMSIVSRKMKAGRSYSQYGCSARHHKGTSVCANGLTIGEARLTEAVLGALRSYFASPEYEAWLEQAYEANRRARARAARRDDELARLEADLRSVEARRREGHRGARPDRLLRAAGSQAAGRGGQAAERPRGARAGCARGEGRARAPRLLPGRRPGRGRAHRHRRR